MNLPKLTLAATALLLVVAAVAQASTEGPPCNFEALAAMQRAATNVSLIVTELDKPAAAMSPSNRGLGVFTVQSSNDESWVPIRIGIFTEDLNDASKYCTKAGATVHDFNGGTSVCSSEDVFDSKKKSLLVPKLLANAAQLHRERLLVQPVTGFKVPVFTEGPCAHFTVPSSHQTEGVPDLDFILYVSAAPPTASEVAWAATCASHASGRPAVGVMNISPKAIVTGRRATRLVAHEMLHALGFSAENFRRANMTRTIPQLRGKMGVPVVSSPNVIQRAGNHYGCDEVYGMELEDEVIFRGDGSHWKRRNAQDDLMAIHYPTSGYYTAITIAAMEDLGYYRGDYSKAEYMSYGFKAGCDLFTTKCISNDVNNFPKMFCRGSTTDCDGVGPMRCLTSRFGEGRCLKQSHPNEIPPQFQYFSKKMCAGKTPNMDLCSVVQEVPRTSCETGGTTTAPGAVISPNSRCLDADFTFNTYNNVALCAEVVCDSDTRTYTVAVKGATSAIACPEGTTMELKTLSRAPEFANGGTLECAAYSEVCPGLFDSVDLPVKLIPIRDATAHIQQVLVSAVVAVALLLLAAV